MHPLTLEPLDQINGFSASGSPLAAWTIVS